MKYTSLRQGVGTNGSGPIATKGLLSQKKKSQTAGRSSQSGTPPSKEIRGMVKKWVI